ncbi:MAG: PrgI family protein [Candidatus Pacebacteria bacterium]|nr:PrgI family protein [Candidatus Paceibacterota bacterium]MDR3582794.1 PrgI family protein [Candidatus Paceibacterota bacterium]
MALFNVPQFIDIEDKIVGPLTAKQLGWLAIGGVIFLVLWGTVDTSTLIVTGVIDAAVFGAFAFYKPYNQPLFNFIMSSIYFSFRPRVYVWRRTYAKIGTMRRKPTKAVQENMNNKKSLNGERIIEISNILDQK